MSTLFLFPESLLTFSDEFGSSRPPLAQVEAMNIFANEFYLF